MEVIRKRTEGSMKEGVGKIEIHEEMIRKRVNKMTEVFFPGWAERWGYEIITGDSETSVIKRRRGVMEEHAMYIACKWWKEMGPLPILDELKYIILSNILSWCRYEESKGGREMMKIEHGWMKEYREMMKIEHGWMKEYRDLCSEKLRLDEFPDRLLWSDYIYEGNISEPMFEYRYEEVYPGAERRGEGKN
jgi:hypothetical protein